MIRTGPPDPRLARLLDPGQVSTFLGVPVGTLANWRYLGRGPAFVRIGRHVRYRADDLWDFVDRSAVDRRRRAVR